MATEFSNYTVDFQSTFPTWVNQRFCNDAVWWLRQLEWLKQQILISLSGIWVAVTLSSAEFDWSQLGTTLGCWSESSVPPVSPILGPRLKKLWDTFLSWWTVGLAESKPHSTSTTQASAPMVTASTVMATPNTGKEVHLSHRLEKGIEENGQNNTNSTYCPAVQNCQKRQLMAHW